VKVGDLVRCVSANGLVGLITKIMLNAHKSLIYIVLVGGVNYPFRSNMLEVISESRRYGKNSPWILSTRIID